MACLKLLAYNGNSVSILAYSIWIVGRGLYLWGLALGRKLLQVFPKINFLRYIVAVLSYLSQDDKGSFSCL